MGEDRISLIDRIIDRTVCILNKVAFALAVLSGQLVVVVQETVQTDEVSLWLSEGLAGERQPEAANEN